MPELGRPNCTLEHLTEVIWSDWLCISRWIATQRLTLLGQLLVAL